MALEQPASRSAGRIVQLRDYLSEILRGGEPFGPSSPDLLRRAHTTALPELAGGALAGPRLRGGRIGWPELPLAAGRILTGAQVQELVTVLLANGEIAGDDAGTGLTASRCKAALGAAGTDPSTIGRVTPALLLWLSIADVLAAPADAVAPWATARPLRLTEPDVIQRRLRETAPPTPDAVAAERARGLR